MEEMLYTQNPSVGEPECRKRGQIPVNPPNRVVGKNSRVCGGADNEDERHACWRDRR